MRKDSDNAKLLEPGELPSKRKVLVVEDNELNSEIAMAILNEYGFQVHTAENGAEAVEKIRNSAPGDYELILMDIQMPVMNGYEVLQVMKEKLWLDRIPVISISADSSDDNIGRAYSCVTIISRVHLMRLLF